MTWLTWRQHRLQALSAVAGLAALAALMVPSGMEMRRVFAASGLGRCLDSLTTRPVSPDPVRCDALAGTFNAQFERLNWLTTLFLFLPVVIGMFWGAPLVAREAELGTHRFVWAQGVTRLRWAAVKVGLICAGAVTIAAAYSALLSWWMAPLHRATGARFSSFVDGAVPVGYTLFAVALGMMAGAMTRRVLPAMAVTLVGFGIARAAVSLVRSSFLAPLQRTYPVADGTMPDRLLGDWILDEAIYGADGQRIGGRGNGTCSNPTPEPTATGDLTASPLPDCAATLPGGSGAYNVEVYQPADRFWLFQTTETAIFMILAAVLIASTVLLVHRRAV